ncbi:MAG: thioredoxin family protein [Flavobacteriaceae bacterium]
MKKKILILFLIVGTYNLEAQELKWYTDMNQAMKVSKKTKKPLMLFFTGSDWCGWCIRLQKEVLKTPEFAKWSDKVVLVELDFPRKTAQPQEIKDQNMNLQQLLGVRGYPTVWFVKATEGKDGKINLEQLGSTGYVAGGPTVWLEGANQILANKKA